jgi:thiamine transporter
MAKQSDSKTHILVESAILVAVASVLSIFPKLEFLPYGGSITICSMLPIILISYRRGPKWGFLSAFVFAIIQLLTGLHSIAGLSLITTVLAIILDYIIAFTVLGFGGVFRNKFKKRGPELVLGTVLATILRFLVHIISGIVVWGEYADNLFAGGILESLTGGKLIFVYSLLYNATYMVPEIIITTIVALLISKFALYKVSE